MSCTIVEQLGQLGHGGGGAVGLLGCKLANGGEASGIDGAGVEEQSAGDFMNAQFVGGVKGKGKGRIGKGGKLCFGAVIRSLPRVWRVFRFGGGKSREKMIGVGNVGVTNTEVVDHHTEGDVAGLVPPEARGQRYRFIAVGGKEFDDLIIGESSGLGQAVYTATNFDENGAVVDERAEIILFDDGVRNHVDEGNAHVLKVFHGGPKIKVFEIGGEELRTLLMSR